MSSDPTRLHEGSTLGELVLRALCRHPEREAVICGDHAVSYAQLRTATAALAGTLRRAGVRPGHGLAVLARNRVEVVTAYCAAYLLGARLTPLSPHASPDDVAFIVADAGILWLLVDEKGLHDRGAALAARGAALGLRGVFTFGPSTFGSDASARPADERTAPLQNWSEADAAAVLGYTGGTTGRPKGVLHSQRSMVAMHLMMLAEWEWPERPRMLLATPLSHAAGVMILPTLLKGGTVVMLDGFDPGSFIAEIGRRAINVTFLVPTMIYALLDKAREARHEIASLKRVFYGAAPMAPTRLREAIEVFGPVFMQLYGQSEAPLCISVLRADEHDLTRPERLASCGQPCAGLSVAVLDERNEPVAPGAVGEIAVRGPLVMLGYHQRDEETTKAFASGWLHTGDVGRFDQDGYLYIVDRLKELIISGGFNVYPREVELVLERHPAVARCTVVGLADAHWGEAVTAAVVRAPGDATPPEALIEFVRAQKGPVYAPKRVAFVESLPLTPLGKPDRAALRAQLAVAMDSSHGVSRP